MRADPGWTGSRVSRYARCRASGELARHPPPPGVRLLLGRDDDPRLRRCDRGRRVPGADRDGRECDPDADQHPERARRRALPLPGADRRRADGSLAPPAHARAHHDRARGDPRRDPRAAAPGRPGLLVSRGRHPRARGSHAVLRFRGASTAAAHRPAGVARDRQRAARSESDRRRDRRAGAGRRAVHPPRGADPLRVRGRHQRDRRHPAVAHRGRRAEAAAAPRGPACGARHRRGHAVHVPASDPAASRALGACLGSSATASS